MFLAQYFVNKNLVQCIMTKFYDVLISLTVYFPSKILVVNYVTSPEYFFVNMGSGMKYTKIKMTTGHTL